MFTPHHLVVVFPHDVLRIGQARVSGKHGVTARKNEIPVLPEHPDWYCVDNPFDELLGYAQRILDLTAFDVFLAQPFVRCGEFVRALDYPGRHLFELPCQQANFLAGGLRQWLADFSFGEIPHGGL